MRLDSRSLTMQLAKDRLNSRGGSACSTNALLVESAAFCPPHDPRPSSANVTLARHRRLAAPEALQRVAARCSALQRVAARCSALQRRGTGALQRWLKESWTWASHRHRQTGPAGPRRPAALPPCRHAALAPCRPGAMPPWRPAAIAPCAPCPLSIASHTCVF